MSIIIGIILGAFIGWAASKVLGEDHGFIKNLVIGVIGSFIGGFVSKLFTGGDNSYLAFSWMGLFWSFVGAVILLVAVNALQKRGHHAA